MENQFVSCVPTAIKVDQMRVIKNLIEVRIPDDQFAVANFKEGLKINVKSEKPFIVNAFWIVKIVDIHRGIEKDWKMLQKELAEGTFLSDNQGSLCQSERQIHHTVREQVQCRIEPPQEIDTSKFDSKKLRDFYPLVIVVTCLVDDETISSATSAAANIQLIHIKDEIVPVKSHVIKQYIKLTDSRVLDISQLYTEESDACFICFEEASDEEAIKLFCLLPCRHSPICSNCIRRIRECPKCRCPIASVFDINAPQMDANAQPAVRPTIGPSLSHLYDDADDGRARNNRRQGGFLSSLKSMFGL